MARGFEPLSFRTSLQQPVFGVRGVTVNHDFVGSNPIWLTKFLYGDCSLMVERQIVVLLAVGSSPIFHPNYLLMAEWINAMGLAKITVYGGNQR